MINIALFTGAIFFVKRGCTSANYKHTCICIGLHSFFVCASIVANLLLNY